MTPYYDDGVVTIYHGDCRDILPALRGDLVLTDPPYGVDKAEWDSLFHSDWMEAAARTAPVMGLMPGIVNILQCPPRIGELSYRWTLAAHLVNGMTRGALGYGNWIPCLIYAADGVRLFRQTSDAHRVIVGTEGKPDHPSPKPLRAMTWMVESLSAEGAIVIDPFMGSGTTLLAAKTLGRRAIGIEINERYCQVAVGRLAQGVLPLFEEAAG